MTGHATGTALHLHGGFKPLKTTQMMFGLMCVLMTPPALAADGGETVPFDVSPAGMAPYADPSAVPARIAVEGLVGGLGAIGGGMLGLFAGSEGGSVGMLAWGVVGVSCGSYMGTFFGGAAMGGNGNLGFTFLGAAGGSLLSVLMLPLLAQTGLVPLVLGTLLALPVTGAIIGYEASHAAGNPYWSRGQPWRFMPTVALTRDGKGAAAGLAGTF
jgi:hypothetical protein